MNGLKKAKEAFESINGTPVTRDELCSRRLL
jgi:hypothetical protein